MAPERSKPNEKISFDDELGDDFLSSYWKPSKSLAALDFEDDQPTPKNSKASFSMTKMDTSFDFDFDGGLNALSKFNVDMSDLDLPSSRDKTLQKKDVSHEKRSHSGTKKGESKFSFQFNGFDELDLDDTLRTNKVEPETPVYSKTGKEDISYPSTATGYCRTNKEPETSVYSKKGKDDFSPSSTASRYCNQELRDSNSDDASESTLMPMAGTSINKESHKTWKREPAPNQGEPSGGLTFSDDENSVHELGLPLQDKQDQACTDNYTPQKRTDSNHNASTMISKEATKVASPTRAHVDVSEEPDDRNESEDAAPSELDVESSRKSPSNIEVSSDIEAHELPVENEGLGMMQFCCKEELKATFEMDDIPQSKESLKVPCTENLILGTSEEPSKKEEREQQKSLAYKLEPRQGDSNDEQCLLDKGKVSTKNVDEGIVLDSIKVPVELSDTRPKKGQGAELNGISRANAFFAPKQSNKPQAVPTGISPRAPPGRSAKRKFSGELRTSDSPSSKGNSSKKLEVDDISKKTEEQQASDSATSQIKCKDLQSSPAENHHDTSPFYRKTAPKVVADRSLQGATFLSKTTIRSSSLQVPRLLLGTRGNDSKLQEQAVSLVKVKTPITSLCNNAAERKLTMLGGLQSQSLPSTVQQKRSLYQLNLTKDLSNTNLGRNRPVAAGKQLEGLKLRKTSSLAVLSKTKVTGALRETCEKTYNFDVPATSKGTIASHSSTGIDKLKSVETPDEELPVPTPEKPDTEMADIQKVETLRESLDKEILETKDDQSLLAVSIENDDGIREKSENYANRLDQLLKELKDKYEEAMDLRVKAIVVNNNFLMLNNPVDDEKIRKITAYVQEKLSLETQGQVVLQQS